MDQVDDLLARFPGPVTLVVSAWRRWLGLAVSLGLGGFVAWLLFGEEQRWRYLAHGGEVAMAWLSLAVFVLLALRAVVLLLVPACASLTLDGDGFEIG